MAKESTITLTLKVDDKGTIVLDSFRKQIKKTGDDVEKISKSMQVVSAAAFISIAQQIKSTGAEIFRFVEMGAKVKSLEDAFVLMGKNSGVAVGNLLSELKKATKETVDDSDLIMKATRMMAEGFSGEQIVRMGEMARTTARLMGVDVTEAYERVSDAVLMLRTRGLKTAGIMIDMDAAYEKHAKTLGTTKDALNEYGKQMALFEAVSQKVLEIEKKLGMEVTSASEKFQQAKATWKDVWEAIAKGISAAVSPVLVLIRLTLEGIDKVKAFSDKIEMWKYRTGLGSEAREKAIDEAEMLRENPALKFVSGEGPEKKSQVDKEKAAEEETKRIKKILDGNKELREQWAKMAEGLERQVNPEFAAFWEILKGMDIDVVKLNKDTDIWFSGVLENLKEFHYEAPKEGPWTEMGLTEAAFNYYRETAKEATIARSEWVEAQKEILLSFDDIGKEFSDVLTSNMSLLLSSTESWGKKFKKVGESILQTMLQIIAKQLVMDALFSNPKEGTGFMGGESRLGGLFKGAVSAIGGISFGGGAGYALSGFGPQTSFSYQHGTDYVPRTGLAMLHQGEKVVPAGRNKEGGNTIIYMNVEATDVDSFERKYGPSVTKITRSSARRGGIARKTMRSYI